MIENKNNIKVSIIIPVYNSSEYLDECLTSCVNQTLKEIEIVVVDNDSIDNSLEIIEKFAKNDKRIKILSKKNEGAGAARNFAVDKCEGGEFILFLDSDDFLELNALEILYKQMINEKSDVIFFNANWIFEKINTKNKINITAPYCARFKQSPFKIDEAYDILFDTNALAFRMYRKNLWIEKNIKYSNHKLAEDALPYFEYLANSKIISFCEEHLYNYRKHPASATASTQDKVNDLFEIFYLCENVILKTKTGGFLIESYLNNRIRSFIFWLHSLPLNKRKKYYKKVREVFLFIKNNYGCEKIENSEFFDEFKKIIKLSYFKYRFLNLTKTVFIILKSHFV